MKIFPMNLKKEGNKWYNYSNYLNWLDSDIQSIKDYLKMFNPDFSIINEQLHAIQSSNWQPVDINGSGNNYIEGDTFLAYKLKFREGYYASNDIKVKYTTDDTESRTLIGGQVIFATRKKPTLNSYLIMSQPLAGIYFPQNMQNGLKYTLIENGQSVVNNIVFSLEFFPCRYLLLDNNDKKWGPNTGWTAQGAYWQTQNSDPSLKIVNGNGNIWNDSFPLMHETYLKIGDSMEEIVFDQTFNTEKITIAGHLTAAYNITTNLTPEETSEESLFDDNVYVSII